MEVIADELKKNGIRIDIETLSEHIEYILGNYKDCYNEAVDRLNSEELILDVFHEMNVNSLGRAIVVLEGHLSRTIPRQRSPAWKSRYNAWSPRKRKGGEALTLVHDVIFMTVHDE